ncbi:hypothetical protein [Qipengyuania soli]|uniref:Uncharacterized protein n=1 Tax=Qipengyuania soli TaxID=2782568 RepID=A0A7S8F535_9SPHN|nr:hypothetical protein [Qipengyuania soli]QPC99148.1 hypothetical protein IRL76_00755 [Qipengyuania soli]
MATRNFGDEILTLDNELITVGEIGGEEAIESQPGVLLLHDELPPDPPVRKIDVKPRLRSDPGAIRASSEPPEDDGFIKSPRLAWSAVQSEPVERTRDIAPPEPVEKAQTPLETALHGARKQALVYHFVEARTRAALYEAIGKAYDFSLIARRFPVEYLRHVEDAGIEISDRARLVALAKLVFGKDYDKTRLSEIAAVISYCQREALKPGSVPQYIADTPGGIRHIVALERLLKNAEEGAEAPAERTVPRQSIARKLAKVEAHGLELLDGEGDEYVLVIARRDPAGSPCLLGEVPRDIGLLEKAARSFLAEGKR